MVDNSYHKLSNIFMNYLPYDYARSWRILKTVSVAVFNKWESKQHKLHFSVILTGINMSFLIKQTIYSVL